MQRRRKRKGKERMVVVKKLVFDDLRTFLTR